MDTSHPQFASPLAVLIFGANCAGKSTVGRALAGRLPKCSFIEVDELMYKVVGGLVAYSDGLHPRNDPEGYRQQCWMAVDNAVRLAEGFAHHGFSSVIEGLEEDCRPGTGWSDKALANLPSHSVALVCSEVVLKNRWEVREQESAVPVTILDSLIWYQQNVGLFDTVVDTSSTSPDEAAEVIYGRVTESTI